MKDWPSTTAGAGCSTTADCRLPVGFFRLRYFHGKQMRLADYVDEQRYHAGKMRFHNEKLHGAGILCGLGVALLEHDGLLLRVARGAALDDCGREIVVGWDQCVDVDAWFRHQKRQVHDAGQDRCKPDANQRVHLCVVLRYAECRGAPEPAPRDTCASADRCGCEAQDAMACPDPCAEGAEYGRVTEEFELRLMFADEARRLTAHGTFPAAADIDAAVATAFGGVGLLQELAGPMRRQCPPAGEGWLLLACFDVVIDRNDPAKVNTVVDIDQRCASQMLLSTEVLQYLVAGLVAEVDPTIGGPEIRDIRFVKVDSDRYQFRLLLSQPIDPASLDVDSSFSFRRLSRGGWETPASNVVTMTYKERRSDPQDEDVPTIYIDVDNKRGQDFLRPRGRYQLYTPVAADPVVDAALQPLRPRQLVYRFRIESNDQGHLEMRPLTAGDRHA